MLSDRSYKSGALIKKEKLHRTPHTCEQGKKEKQIRFKKKIVFFVQRQFAIDESKNNDTVPVRNGKETRKE
jgi:hypothetical protein